MELELEVPQVPPSPLEELDLELSHFLEELPHSLSIIVANRSELTECTHENDAPVNAIDRGEARLSSRHEEPLDGVGDGALPRGGGGQELGVGLRSPQLLSGVIRFHGGVSMAE